MLSAGQALLGFAPEPDHWAGNRPPYAACFSQAEPGSWLAGGSSESRKDRWLRLSGYGLVELLPVADTEAGADRVRVKPDFAAAMGLTIPGRSRPDPGDGDVFLVRETPTAETVA